MDMSGIPDFDDLKINAKIIDSEITYLTNKVANPLNLGLSNDPEKLREDAIEIINQIRENLTETLNELKYSAENQAEVLSKIKDKNENIANHIEELSSELTHYESQLSAYGYKKYVEESDTGLDAVTDITFPSPSIEKSLKYDTNLENIDPNPNTMQNNEEEEEYSQETSKVQNSQIPVGMKLFTPLSRKWNRSFRNATLPDVSSDSFEVFGSTDILEKPNNTPGITDRRGDDACKTPTDPGVSDVTMKLLGKNDLRYKMYQNPQAK